MQNNQNHVDMADICELAHKLTIRDCLIAGIPVDIEIDDDEIGYTEKAQEIYDHYYELITTTLNV